MINIASTIVGAFFLFLVLILLVFIGWVIITLVRSMENEIGKRYGNLTVIKKLDRREHETSVYLCKCDCGNLKEVNINKLHTGHTKSCGCLKNRIKDYTGQRFGRLTVISLNCRRNNKTYWNCKCDCGNECVVRELVEYCSPVTYYHLNLITEGILSMPGGISGLFNIFEYDENLQYNAAKKTADIERYGLYTYDDFSDLVPYDFYAAFPTPYLKVAVGKGLISEEDIKYLIDRYLPIATE